MNARQRRQDRRRLRRRAEGIHDAFPAKCPITGRRYFMTLDHPELGMVPTYGGPYDSYTIPHTEGEPTQPWHERELVQHRYDHDAGGWLLDVVETIPLRIIHDDVRSRLEDAEETLLALGYTYERFHWKKPSGVAASFNSQENNDGRTGGTDGLCQRSRNAPHGGKREPDDAGGAEDLQGMAGERRHEGGAGAAAKERTEVTVSGSAPGVQACEKAPSCPCFDKQGAQVSPCFDAAGVKEDGRG